MKEIYKKVKETVMRTVGGSSDFDDMDDYVEIDTDVDQGPKARVLVRPFFIEDFADIKPALDALREGTTIALINIRPLKDKDIIELKRAVNKLKKTCDAIEGVSGKTGLLLRQVLPRYTEQHKQKTFKQQSNSCFKKAL